MKPKKITREEALERAREYGKEYQVKKSISSNNLSPFYALYEWDLITPEDYEEDE